MNPLKIAVAGFGAMGQIHTKCYQLLQKTRLVAIVNSDERLTKKAQSLLGLDLPVYPDLDALFAAEDVDVLDICLPTDLHFDWAMAGIAAGKQVICEKPLAPTSQQAKAMARAARLRGVSLAAGHCIRFWPEYVFLEEAVRSEKYGKLTSLTMQRRSSLPAYSNGNWLHDKSRAGGAVTDLHIHDTDYVMHLLGRPQAVTSTGHQDQTGWAHVFTMYHFPDCAVTAEGGWDYPPKWGFNMSFQAIFEKGLLEFDFRTVPTLKLTSSTGKATKIATRKPAGATRGPSVGNISDLGGYYNQLRYFSDCFVAGHSPEIATGEQAAATLQLLESEVKSLVTGKTVQIRQKKG